MLNHVELSLTNTNNHFFFDKFLLRHYFILHFANFVNEYLFKTINLLEKHNIAFIYLPLKIY